MNPIPMRITFTVFAVALAANLSGCVVVQECQPGDVRSCSCPGAGMVGEEVCASDHAWSDRCSCGCAAGYVGDGAGGCVIPTADITFRWSFDGNWTCAETPEAASIRISLTGPKGPEPLGNHGLYDCSTAGVDGIALLNFGLGNYSYLIEALDSSGAVAYSASGDFALAGDKTVLVVLR